MPPLHEAVRGRRRRGMLLAASPHIRRCADSHRRGGVGELLREALLLNVEGERPPVYRGAAVLTKCGALPVGRRGLAKQPRHACSVHSKRNITALRKGRRSRGPRKRAKKLKRRTPSLRALSSSSASRRTASAAADAAASAACTSLSVRRHFAAATAASGVGASWCPASSGSAWRVAELMNFSTQ